MKRKKTFDDWKERQDHFLRAFEFIDKKDLIDDYNSFLKKEYRKRRK